MWNINWDFFCWMHLINAYNHAIRLKFQLKYEMRDGKKTTLSEVILLCPMILKLAVYPYGSSVNTTRHGYGY